VETKPAAADSSVGTDAFGNTDFYYHVTSTHRQLEVVSTSVVRVRRPEISAELWELPWERARPSAATAVPPASESGTWADAIDFTLPSPRLVIPDEARAYAERTFTPGRPIGDAIVELTHRIKTEFTYKSGTTTVRTSVEDVLAQRTGVCQDFAHVAIACLRSIGLAGRYISGYLATQPPPGKERMVGVDATHAWAAVWLPDGSWLAFDPTNDQLADERYTTVAWGRDYGDVPPLRGVIFTESKKSVMKVSVDVAPLGTDTPDTPPGV
jgi:transglutaminase-like putative cysteine protease